MSNQTARACLWGFAAVLLGAMSFRVVLADPRDAVIVSVPTVEHHQSFVSDHPM